MVHLDLKAWWLCGLNSGGKWPSISPQCSLLAPIQYPLWSSVLRSSRLQYSESENQNNMLLLMTGTAESRCVTSTGYWKKKIEKDLDDSERKVKNRRENPVLLMWAQVCYSSMKADLNRCVYFSFKLSLIFTQGHIAPSNDVPFDPVEFDIYCTCICAEKAGEIRFLQKNVAVLV